MLHRTLSPILLVAALGACAGGSGSAGTEPAPAATPAASAPQPAAQAPAPQPAAQAPAPAQQGAAPSAAATGPRQAAATTRVTTGEGGQLSINAMSIDTDVRLFSTGTVDQVWSVLPVVYAELGIPLTVNDPRTKTIGNEGWRTRRSIGKVPMYRYLDCGSSGTLQNAETYNIFMNILTTVKPNAGGGSEISTAITATGKNPVTSSTAEVRCATKGDLEIRIRDMVQKKVQGM